MFARLMGLKTISPANLDDLLKTPGAVHVYDVNSSGSWTQAHVPGATHLDPAGYQESELPRDKSALLVFYCSNPLCRKAPHAARRAEQMGYSNVQVMSSGISGWISARLPTESGGAKP